MKKSSKWIICTLAAACLIFFLSPGAKRLIHNANAFELREQLVFLTGVCAISLMTLAMIISVRFEQVNKKMGGLDKAYVVHKWAGIFSFLFAVIHWLLEKVPHLLVEWNIIPDPGELTDGSRFSELEIALFQSGVFIAEVLFYVFALLIIIALVNKIPYRYFRITHKNFPAVFLLLAYHAATAQLKEHWLNSSAGYLLLLLLAAGSIAAVIALLQQIGKSRKTTATIKSMAYHKKGILDIRLQMSGRPFIHQAGQYAFLQFAHSREAHPFTIVSSGDNPHILRFAIKELGDFTSDLNSAISVGQPVTIEGPYGGFKFEDNCERQIWIAGGIGITPFLARLEYLSSHGGAKKTIDFWYCTRGDLESQFPASLQKLCKDADVNFYHVDSNKMERLTIDLLKSTVGDFDNLSIWFCGPKEFAASIQGKLKPYKSTGTKFHYDNFNMR